jgi:myo-inositol-1(or 4)-monophosphatase
VEEKMREVAIEAAKAAGEVLLRLYQRRASRTWAKEDTSLVTEADLAAEQAIITRLHTAFCDHRIESEEQGLWNVGNAPYHWKVDPLDGTENFVLGLPYFSTSLLLSADHRPVLAVVYEPVTQHLYTAVRGSGAWLNGERIHVSQNEELKHCRTCFIPDFATKRHPRTIALRNELYRHCRRVLDTWSPALDWCLVASGRADLLVALSGHPMVPDAGTLFLEEAGGQITDFQGNGFPGPNQRCLVASNGKLHQQFFHLAQQEVQEWSW